MTTARKSLFQPHRFITAHRPGLEGVQLFTPLDSEGKNWRATKISGPEVAVEDIKAADLNEDGRPDIVAAARQTKNLKIFFTVSD